MYTTFELAEGEYPGLTVVEERADARCAQLLDVSPPQTVSGPEYGYLYLYPHGRLVAGDPHRRVHRLRHGRRHAAGLDAGTACVRKGAGVRLA